MPCICFRLFLAKVPFKKKKKTKKKEKKRNYSQKMLHMMKAIYIPLLLRCSK